MVKVTNQQFLSALTKTNNELRRFSEEILQTTEEALYEKPSPDRWNVIECFSHMNKSTELYLSQMENQLSRLKPESDPGYKKATFARIFTRWLAPDENGGIHYKMKTMKPFFPDPSASNDKKAEIHRFQNNLDRYGTLLERMEGKDLRSFKVTTAIGPVLKFYAGDAMHFIHAHNLRHAQQVKNILSQVSADQSL